ncbi:DnaT-like ssDNA-binding protein [Pseudochrobactrum asaccharolyticum]|uniref:Putative DnaT-like domain-containing protein n=1 Tax=Pseudochrobactrum asaccharolyticum TaxID=354351 RepID=A0A366DP21_9HYPH|nr:DnaT-like ssDNA-binding protein [Pseudochrobactrum asaccharolyticum]RBO91034.1 hypothetical protein DFR47_11031 [Pseudochrobactrum asaccharolyticum]
MPITSTISSYASTEQFKAHCEALGHSLVEFTDSDIHYALRNASEYLDATYGSRFIGETATFGQSLAWPRKRAKFQGRFFPDNEIPEKIITASCEAAFASLAGVGEDQELSVIENILSGLIQPEQAGASVFGSVARVQHGSV